MSSNDTPVPANGADMTREKLAIVVLIVGAVVMLALGVGVIVLSTTADRPQEIKLVFGTVVPLVATWIGTVLAYYYSRENLAAATSSVTSLARQITGMERLQSIRVKDRMIARDRIVSLAPDDLAKLDAQTLAHVLEEMDKRRMSRLVVFDDKGAVSYLVHASKINEFVSKQALDGKDVSKLTFADLTADAAMKKVFTTTFVAVGPEATLAEAKLAMEQRRGCEDVFVTTTGKLDGEVLGWITDNQISIEAKA